MKIDERIKKLEDDMKNAKEDELKSLREQLKEAQRRKSTNLKFIYIAIITIVIATLSIGYSFDLFGGKTLGMIANITGLSDNNNKLKTENKMNKIQLDRVQQLVELFELIKNPEMDKITFKQISDGFVLINHIDDNMVTNLPIFKAICNQLQKDGYNALVFGRLYWSTGGRVVWSSSNWTNETDMGVVKEYLQDKNIKVFFLGSNVGNIYLSNPFKGQTNGFLTINIKKSIPFFRDSETIIKTKTNNDDGNFEAKLDSDGDFHMKYNLVEEDFFKKVMDIYKDKIPNILK